MKIFKPKNILFCLLALVNFLIIGAIAAKLLGAGVNQGLAGGAIVLGYGVLAAAIAFLLAIVAVYYLHEKFIILFNKILLSILFLFVLYIAYNVITREEKPEEKFHTPRKPTTPVVSSIINFRTPAISKEEMGLGMASPDFFNNNIFYFYNNPNLKKSVRENWPADSIVFRKTEIGIEIAEAPPWLYPEYIKMDYEIFLMKIISIQYDFIEVEVNKQTQQTFYIDRQKSKIKFWPEFLLSVNSIEAKDYTINPVRIKPLTNASLVNKRFSFLKPVKIKSNWIFVNLVDDNYNIIDEGWIKWNEEGKLLVKYSLLS